MKTQTTKPRFKLNGMADLAASGVSELMVGDVHTAYNWIGDNADTNKFAESLNSQYEKYNGITERQWELAYMCAASNAKANLMHNKAIKSQFRKSGKPDNAPAQVSNDITQDVLGNEPKAQKVTNTPRDLSKKQKNALKDAVKNHPNIDDFKTAFDVQRLRLDGKQLFDACDYLGIDVDQFLQDRTDQMQSAFNSVNDLQNDVGGSINVDWKRVREIVRDEIERRTKPVIKTKIVLDQGKTKQDIQIDGIKHPKFDLLFAAINTVDFSGNYLNVILCGPTGTGKSFAARQIAKALGLSFFLQVQALENYELIGYERIDGTIKETPFLRAFRDGGVILLDEMDSYDPKALTALNSALANGEILMPDGSIVKRHKDFRCIAATNTNGLGATHDYTSREQLDLATISRFGALIDWHVNRDMELTLATAHNGEQGKAWAHEVDKARDAMARLDLPALADQRTIEAGIGLMQNGLNLDEIRELTYLANLSSDQRQAVLNIVEGKA